MVIPSRTRRPLSIAQIDVEKGPMYDSLQKLKILLF